MADPLSLRPWLDCLIRLARALLNDLDPENYQWSNDRLIQLLDAASYLVHTELSGCDIDKPAIDCDGLTIDPLTYAGFVNLVVLKATCLIEQGLLRDKMTMDGIRATCGPATLQVAANMSGYRILFEQGACAGYNALKEDLCFRNPIQTAANCAQILGPFVSEDYYFAEDQVTVCDR